MNEFTKVHFSEHSITFSYVIDDIPELLISITIDGVRFYDNGYSYIPYDLCALALLQEEYFNSLDKEENLLYDQFTDVDIFYNDELGEYLWSVCDHYDFEYWIQSFKTEKEAIDFCEEKNYTIKSIIS